MTLTRTINLRRTDIVQRFNRYLSSDHTLSGVFKGVFTKSNGKWSLLVGYVRLGCSNKVNVSDQRLEYPEYLFVSGSLNTVNIGAIVSDLELEGKLPINKTPMLEVGEQGLNWTETLIPSHATEGGFPIRRFSTDINRNIYCSDTKLVAHGMKFHSSSFEYIKDFFGVE